MALAARSCRPPRAAHAWRGRPQRPLARVRRSSTHSRAPSGAEPDDVRHGPVLRRANDGRSPGRRVETVRVPTVFNDSGRATLRLGAEEPGPPRRRWPSPLNEVTVTDIACRFSRADGRNTPGVDVPYGFDGGVTVTIPAADRPPPSSTSSATRPRWSRRSAGSSGGGAAQHDQHHRRGDVLRARSGGNEVTVTGLMTVNFGDFGDPR